MHVCPYNIDFLSKCYQSVYSFLKSVSTHGNAMLLWIWNFLSSSFQLIYCRKNFFQIQLGGAGSQFALQCATISIQEEFGFRLERCVHLSVKHPSVRTGLTQASLAFIVFNKAWSLLPLQKRTEEMKKQGKGNWDLTDGRGVWLSSSSVLI